LKREVFVARNRIAVTGIGAVTSVAANTAGFLEALLHPVPTFGESRRHTVGFDVLVGEAAPTWFAEIDDRTYDSETGRLSLSAARECVNQVTSRGGKSPDGLVFGTSTGGQAENERVVFDILRGRSPSVYDYRLRGCMAAPSRLIARDLNIRGPMQTVSTACTSGANAVALAATWIRSGRCRRVLVGGGDALCRTTISSFHILELTGAKRCRPFGVDRPGLTLGDGAGFLMLEALETVRKEGRRPLAEIAGFGMSSDAHHMTAPHPEGAGAQAAMVRALSDADVSPRDVDYINAHGTGTRLNDASEAEAIRALFGNTPVMSCKGLVGHTLGGAGGVEAVASVLSLVNRTAFENCGAHTAGEDCPVMLIGGGGMRLRDDAVVVSTSFAFGGNNCVLVFKGTENEP
jgi:3-oxoacyl-(acyl-carrier-protein) synthase